MKKAIIKQVSPFTLNGIRICYAKQIESEMPHYYIYDANKNQVGGALAGTVRSFIK